MVYLKGPYQRSKWSFYGLLCENSYWLSAPLWVFDRSLNTYLLSVFYDIIERKTKKIGFLLVRFPKAWEKNRYTKRTFYIKSLNSFFTQSETINTTPTKEQSIFPTEENILLSPFDMFSPSREYVFRCFCYFKPQRLCYVNPCADLVKWIFSSRVR